MTVLGKSAKTQKFSLLYLGSELNQVPVLGNKFFTVLGTTIRSQIYKMKMTLFLDSKKFQSFLVKLSRNWLHINCKIIFSHVDVLKAQIRPFLVNLLRKEEVQSLTSHAVCSDTKLKESQVRCSYPY